MTQLAKLLLTVATGALLHPAGHAAPGTPPTKLPMSLAAEAAAEALRSCEAGGYQVSVAVIDLAGQTRALLKGDNSTPHTNDTAYRKAYSVVTFGLNYKVDSSAQVAALMSRNPTLYSALLTLPNITPLPGAVAIQTRSSEYVGAIGVSGAPGGDKDEACARAGIAKIADRLAS